MDKNLSPAIQQMVKMAQENQSFRTGLQACHTQSDVMTYLKSNNIMTTTDEITSFTKSSMNKDQNIGGCLINW